VDAYSRTAQDRARIVLEENQPAMRFAKRMTRRFGSELLNWVTLARVGHIAASSTLSLTSSS
jgi:hypothetical protein